MVLVLSAAAAASICELLLCIGGSGEHLTSDPLPTDADFDLRPKLLTGGLVDFDGAASMARSRSSTLQRGTKGTELDTCNTSQPYHFKLTRVTARVLASNSDFSSLRN